MNQTHELADPQWQSLLQEAMLEDDRDKLIEKVLKVEAVIVERLRELPQSSRDEKAAIKEGLSRLKFIKSERLGYPDVQ